MAKVKMNGRMVTPRPATVRPPVVPAVAPKMPPATPQPGLGQDDWQMKLNQVVEAWLMKNVAPTAIDFGRKLRNTVQGTGRQWGSGVPGAAQGKDIQAGLNGVMDLYNRTKR